MARSIVITGASSGIGAACARRFISNGWQVALLARSGDRLARIAQDHPDAVPLQCDVTREDDVEQAFETARQRLGRIDVLFNNAGWMPQAALIDEITLDDWQAALAVNLTGMFLCARAAFGAMRTQTPQGGRIINNGSVSAQAPRPGSLLYSTTKHAVTGLTRTLALDGRAFDIGCGQIDIGNARTELTDGIGAGALQPDGSRRAEPMMDIDDVVEAVRYMAGLPLSANVLNMTVMATAAPLVGRG